MLIIALLDLHPAMLNEKSTLTRGCTGLSDESLYKCDTHKAGSYVGEIMIKMILTKKQIVKKIILT